MCRDRDWRGDLRAWLWGAWAYKTVGCSTKSYVSGLLSVVGFHIFTLTLRLDVCKLSESIGGVM